jgi:hypothetical protein
MNLKVTFYCLFINFYYVSEKELMPEHYNRKTF